MGASGTDDSSKADGLRAGLAVAASAGVAAAGALGSPQAAMPDYVRGPLDANSDAVVSVEDAPISEASSLYTLDAAKSPHAGQEVADAFEDVIEEVQQDLESRRDSRDAIESAPGLKAESAEHRDPPDLDQEPFYQIDTQPDANPPEAIDNVSELEAAEIAAGQDSHGSISDADAAEMAALDNALADVDETVDLGETEANEVGGEVDVADAMGDIGDFDASAEVGGDQFDGGFGGDAGEGGGDMGGAAF